MSEHRGLSERLPNARRTVLRLAPLLAALSAVAVALAFPSPISTSPEGTTGPAGPPGPPRLTDAWPKVQTSAIPAEQSDGYFYHPLLVMDQSLSIGTATSPGVTTTRFVIRSGDGAVRVIRTWPAPQAPAIAATAVSGGRLFWLETGDGPDGNRQTTLWRQELSGGTPVQLAQDTSDVLFYDSGYDLQVVDGRVYWAAITGNGKRSEIRSAPVDGGPVAVRPLDQWYALTAWPWATTSGASLPGPVQLLNLVTGETRTVAATADEILQCTPTWCRVTTLINSGQSLRFEVEHADGQARRKIGGLTLTPLSNDVALLDRFEVLTSTVDTGGSISQLWLLDLKDNRLVLLDDSSTATIGSRGSYLWWSTGDNEALSWHVLDLRALT